MSFVNTQNHKMSMLSDILKGLKPALMMIAVQLALTWVNIFYKIAADDGMNLKVVIAYRFIFAASIVVPLAVVTERKQWGKLNRTIIFQAFFCALLGGSFALNLYAESLKLTSATYASAITNLLPAITFLLATLFREEVLGWMTNAGKAKVCGTFLCFGGAMLLTFYQGIQIGNGSVSSNLGAPTPMIHKSSTSLGLLFALLSVISSAFSLIIQKKMTANYPCLSSTALISIMGAIQTTVYAISTEKDWSQWKLGWNLQLPMMLYMGIIGLALVWTFTMIVIHEKGPLFVSVFNPLTLILVMVFSALFLNETLHLGSVIGGAIIIAGVGTVLWGKRGELVCKESFPSVVHPEEV